MGYFPLSQDNLVRLKNVPKKPRKPPPQGGGTAERTETASGKTRTERPTRIQGLPVQIMQSTTRQTARTPPKRLRPSKWSRRAMKLSVHKRYTNAKLAFKRKLSKPSAHCIADCALNLSTAVISTLEILVLSKGLTFIPKPKRMDIKDLPIQRRKTVCV